MRITTNITSTNGSFINYTTYSGKSVGVSAMIPAVPQMPSKGQCKFSEEELIDRMTRLAKRDAAAGTNSKLAGSGSNSAEWDKLRHDFMSLGSPDRAKIIQSTLSEFAGKINLFGQNKTPDRFEFLRLILSSSQKAGSKTEINIISFCDEEGNQVATYSHEHGWNWWPTSTEGTRSAAFCELWDQALSDAQEELGIEEKQEQAAEEIEMSFLV